MHKRFDGSSYACPGQHQSLKGYSLWFEFFEVLLDRFIWVVFFIQDVFDFYNFLFFFAFWYIVLKMLDDGNWVVVNVPIFIFKVE